MGNTSRTRARLLTLTACLALAGCASAKSKGTPSPAATGKGSGAAAAEAAAPAKTPPPYPALEPAPAAAKLATLELVTNQTVEATALVAAPEPKGRLFLLEKQGKVRILKGTKFNPQPFLDLTGKVALDKRDNGEQGFLGLTFHPQFAKNGRFYVNYTAIEDGATHVEERRVSKNKDKADPKFVKLLLKVAQPYKNHNAGDIAFGPDGKLYVGLGDGGAADDPHGNGQNPVAMLGKLVRFNVEDAEPKPEVVAMGLRNPWRISFDRATGDLYIADVGQNKFEYVHVLAQNQLANVTAPINLGWNVMEGFHCFKDKPCEPSKYQAPIIEYPHNEGCSITGGYVYRGKAFPEFVGQYFYADYCTALVRSLKWSAGKTESSWDWKPTLDPEGKLARISSFGEDQDGELYLVTHEGPVYKLVRQADAK
ncbi:MAG: PQQ-dependent sugar dehydrogenase [Deltaproteobacteria bacterium]|nr:PQQ-dependent sugar dehydrogenase [Deltaproteobacteria bacterium]